MTSIKKALKTTWWIFNAANSKASRVYQWLLLIVPPLAGAGVTLSFLNFVTIIPALLFGIATFIVFLVTMLRTNESQELAVENYLTDQTYIDKSIEFVPDPNLTAFLQDDIKPKYYQGAGAWIANGHINPERFIAILKILDPHVDTIDDSDLLNSVEHIYLLNTYAPRTKREAIKIVARDDPDSYPATILTPPYDNYIMKVGTYPNVD